MITTSIEQLQFLQDEIVKWAKETFAQKNCLAPLFHLAGDEGSCKGGEVQEAIKAVQALMQAVNDGKEPHEVLALSVEAKKEFSDMFILLLNAAGMFDLDVSQLYWFAVHKMEINKARSWQPNANGTYQHVNETDK